MSSSGCGATFLLSTLAHLILAAAVSAENFVLSLQSSGGVVSVEEWAEYLEKIPTLDEFTICHWEYLRHFSEDSMSPWSYCVLKTKDANKIRCTQFRMTGIEDTANRHIEAHFHAESIRMHRSGTGRLQFGTAILKKCAISLDKKLSTYSQSDCSNTFQMAASN